MANRYWVGGTGTWDASNTTNWSATSGGAGGASVPTSADDVYFNVNAGTGTVTLGQDVDCLSCSLQGYTRTFDWVSYKIKIAGNAATVFRNESTYTVAGNPTIELTYSGSTGTRTIAMLATTETKSINVLVSAGSDIITHSTSNFKNLDFTGFSGTLTGVAKTIYGNLTVSTGMTLGATTGVTTFAGTSDTQQITTNGITLDFPLTFNGVGGTFQLQDNLTVGSTRTVTLTNGTLDLNSKTLSTGIFSSSNSNTRSIAFGTGNITLTGNNATIFNGGGTTTTGITITGTPTVNCTYSGSTGTRTLTAGARSVLTEAQTFSFNVSAGSDIVVLSNARAFRSLDFTGFTGTLTSNDVTVYGDLKIASGMTLTSSSSAITFGSTSGTKTITTNGQTVDFPLVFNGIGGTWSFADALTQGSTRAFTIANGTVKLKAGATSTVGAFATSGSNQKYLQSTTADSQATLSQASGTVTVSYLSIKDIAATGGATWNAYVDYNNVDQGDNTGWDFSYSPAIDNEFPIALRSFTQPKRF